jgi:hypothetical protein
MSNVQFLFVEFIMSIVVAHIQWDEITEFKMYLY